MLRTIIGLALTMLITAGLRPAAAQEPPPRPMWAGVTAGFGLGGETASIPIYAGGSADCGLFTSGRSTLISAGGVLLLPDFFGASFGAEARLGVSFASARLATIPADVQRVFDPATVGLVELEREFRIDASVQTLRLELAGRWMLAEHFSVDAGPSIDVRMSSSFTQTDNVLGPGTHAFADGSHQLAMSDGTALRAGTLGIGLSAGIGYELALNEHLALRPEVRLRADILSLVQENSWRTTSAAAGASLLWDLTPAPPPPPPPPVIVEVARIPRLTASLHVSGVDTNHQPSPAAVVRVREVVHRQQSALLPIVFFDSASAELPSRYHRSSAADRDAFDPAALRGASMPEQYLHVLNVIGSRMKRAPGATITLLGAASAEPDGLADERAAAVRNYLRDVWGIDERRMNMAHGWGSVARSNDATADGRAENRRVEIVASPEIAGSVVVETMEQSFTPPTILLAPRADAEAGVRRWNLRVTQRGRTLQEFSGDAGTPPADREWRIEPGAVDTAVTSMEAELVVEDAGGRRVEARDSVPLLFERRRQIVDSRRTRSAGRERLEYSLLNFDFNSAAVSGTNRAEIADVAAVLQEGAVITITGYTDRTGAEEHNAALSRQRAERVAQELRAAIDRRGVHDVQITAGGGGVDDRSYGNDLPEGRMLSRGVRLAIEQGADPSDNP